MSKEKQKNNNLYARAEFIKDSVDSEKRTVKVRFATPTPVVRYSWRHDEYYNEVLDMDGANLTRAAANGLPVLDNHNTWGSVADAVVGRAYNIQRDSVGYTAEVRFSEDEDTDKLFLKVKEGIITDISFGYSVNKIERGEKPAEGLRTYLVTDWTATEISFVTIPADHDAYVLERGFNPIDALFEEKSKVVNLKLNMEIEKMRGILAARGVQISPEASDDQVRAAYEEVTKKPEVTPEPKENGDATDKNAERMSQMMTLAREHGKTIDDVEAWFKGGKSVEEIRTLLLGEYKDSFTGSSARSEQPEGASKAESYLAARIAESLDLSHVLTDVERSHKRSYSSLMDVCAEVVRSSGNDLSGLRDSEIAKLAIGDKDTVRSYERNKSRKFITTSDFPSLFKVAIDRVLMAAYEYKKPTFEPFIIRGKVPSIGVKHPRYSVSSLDGKLLKIEEHGEYVAAKFKDSHESIQVDKYGRSFNISWEAIINDDMDAIARVIRSFALLASELESELVYTNILLGNPVMSDGNQLFSVAHGNTNTGVALSSTSIKAAISLMRKQTDMAGRPINVEPRYLIVGPDNEWVAKEITSAAYTPNTQNNIAPKEITNLQVIVEPLITGTQWFLAASKDQLPCIELDSLASEPAIFVDSEEDFDIDGMKYKVRVCRGAAAIDWRGLYYNAGQ